MSWKIDPRTGDYIVSNGRPTDDPSLIYPAYYRIKIPRTQWMYAPDDQYGSDLYTLKKRFTVNDINPATNLVQRALKPMVDDKRAKSTSTSFQQPYGRNDIEMATTIVDAQGKPQSLNLPAVGGNV